MALHQQALFRRQRAGLVQDKVADPELADVVQVGGAFDGLALRRRQFQLLGQDARIAMRFLDEIKNPAEKAARDLKDIRSLVAPDWAGRRRWEELRERLSRP